MKARYIKLNLIVVLFLLFATVIIMLGGVGQTYAASNNYSNVLDDLQKDSNFNVADYPSVNDDYKLQIIQIAESTSGELFIYVYQPAAKTKLLTATEINMSLSESVDGTHLYSVTLLSSVGVFQKYLVKGVKVSSDKIRYYNITSIYRAFIKGIDEDTGNDNTLNELAFPVSKLFKAQTIDNGVIYSCEIEDVLEIRPEQMYVGYVRYSNGIFTFKKSCDSHYIAFDCDYKITDLYEADVYYEKRSVSVTGDGSFGVSIKNYGEWSSEYAYLTDKQNVNQQPTGWLWGESREYNRIQSVSEFLSSTDLLSNAVENIESKQWVLRFFESDVEKAYSTVYTEVGNVSILRLKFKSDGKLYNLGVVSGKNTGSEKPSNGDPSWLDLLCRWLESVTGVSAMIWKIIITVLPFIIVLGIALPVLSVVFPTFGQFLLWCIKGVVWVICLPFKFIKWIFCKLNGGD